MADDSGGKKTDEKKRKQEGFFSSAASVAGEVVGDVIPDAGCCLAEAAAGIATPDCFLATAALGAPSHPDLDSLRGYRDHVLAKNRAGLLFIRLYYRWGRHAAAAIRGKPVPCFLVREGLIRPLARLARRYVPRG